MQAGTDALGLQVFEACQIACLPGVLLLGISAFAL